MKFIYFILVASLSIYACGEKKKTVESAPVDDLKGFGVTTSVILNDPLNPEMIATGEAIYNMKCSACHKLSPKRIVGPGFKGVTERRKPEWIMNMITNVDVMLDKDPTAQKLFEECLTRMPNQNLTVDDARNVLEYLYANDAAE